MLDIWKTRFWNESQLLCAGCNFVFSQESINFLLYPSILLHRSNLMWIQWALFLQIFSFQRNQIVFYIYFFFSTIHSISSFMHLLFLNLFRFYCYPLNIIELWYHNLIWWKSEWRIVVKWEKELNLI